MNATIECMTRKTTKAKSSEPKQPEPEKLPSVQVRIPGEIAKALEELAKKEWTTLPTQLVLAAQMYLSHKGHPIPGR
jgi:hypothetical protein